MPINNIRNLWGANTWFNLQTKLLKANLKNLLLAFTAYHITVVVSFTLVSLDLNYYPAEYFVYLLELVYLSHAVFLFAYLKDKELSKRLSYKLRIAQLANWLVLFSLWCFLMPENRELTLICAMMVMTFLFAYSTFSFSFLINIIVSALYLLVGYLSAQHLAQEWEYSRDLITVFAFLSSAMLMGLMVSRTTAQLQKRVHNDFLTGLLNRRAMSALIELEHKRSVRFANPVSVVMIDLDNFKYINDHYGHACGDAVLKYVAVQFKKQFRALDFVARWGGEEFMALLVGVTPEQAKMVLDRALEKILKEPMPFEEQSVKVSFSAGVCNLGDYLNAEEAIKEADKMLYQAKKEGKSRVCLTMG